MTDMQIHETLNSEAHEYTDYREAYEALSQAVAELRSLHDEARKEKGVNEAIELYGRIHKILVY